MTFVNSISAKNIWKAVRRRLIYVFNPWYILRNLKIRQEECGDCTCCDLHFLWVKGNCKHFINGRCSVYQTKDMPTLCWIYPFDEKDIWEEHKKRCRFKWKK